MIVIIVILLTANTVEIVYMIQHKIVNNVRIVIMIQINNVNSALLVWVTIINIIVLFVQAINLTVIIVVNVHSSMESIKKMDVQIKVVYVQLVMKIILLWCKNVIKIKYYRVGVFLDLLYHLFY